MFDMIDILALVLEEHWSSANFVNNYPRQKKVPCMWSNMHILRFYFVGQKGKTLFCWLDFPICKIIMVGHHSSLTTSLFDLPSSKPTTNLLISWYSGLKQYNVRWGALTRDASGFGQYFVKCLEISWKCTSTQQNSLKSGNSWRLVSLLDKGHS